MNSPESFPLLPMPKTVEQFGGSARVSLLKNPETTIDTGLPPGGYRINLTESTLRLSHADADGLRSAIATLSQLAQCFDTTLPCLRIEDAPAFATRGFMLDVSRDRVPTMAHLCEIIDLLSSLKFNHLQLYTEHTFAYAGHDLVWQDASPITPDESRLLDTYALERGIELAANQNCFGHLASWLKVPEYAHLAETHGEYDFYGIRRDGPFSLCPLDPGSLELVRDLLTQLTPCFASPMVNIGCDETADIGAGRSSDAVRVHGKARVYGQYVGQVCKEVASLGKRPMFWADIALTHPEAFEWLPDDLLPIAWGYEPDSPFDAWAQTLGGKEHWVSPGTSAWRSFVGRTHERKSNLVNAARSGVQSGATGYLVTEWGDIGHRQTWPITLRAIADAASCAWTGGTLPNDAAVDRFAFAEPGSGLSSWLDKLGDCDRHLRQSGGVPDDSGHPTALKNATALFEELHPSRTPPTPRGTKAEWERVRAELDDLAQRVPSLRADLMQRELAHTLACASVAADVATGRRGGASFDHDRLGLLADEQASLWPARSRPGGLMSSLSHWQQVAEGRTR